MRPKRPPRTARQRGFRWALRAFILIGTPIMLTWVLHLLLFHPPSAESPDVARIGGERVRYQTSDGVTLSSWLVPARGERRRTVVYFHGNAATASDCWGWADVLAAEGSDVLLAEYRGYGQSEGSPSARGIERDAEAAVRFLLDERGVSPDRLVVHGQSLGGAAAIAALAGPGADAAGGVIESAFTSLHDMSRAVIGLPLSWIVYDAYGLDSAARAPGIRPPILQLHGDRDEVIPFRLGEGLREQLHPRRFVRVPGGAHNLVDPMVEREILAFIAEVTS